MFFIGSNVVDWPVQAIRAKDDGHEICVHTWSHEYMTSFSNQQAFAELYYTRKAIKELLGVTPKCWRPPFGDVDNRIRFIAAALNMTTIVWSEDTDDWKVSFSLFPVCGEGVVGCTRLGDSSFDCERPGTRLRFFLGCGSLCWPITHWIFALRVLATNMGCGFCQDLHSKLAVEQTSWEPSGAVAVFVGRPLPTAVPHAPFYVSGTQHTHVADLRSAAPYTPPTPCVVVYLA